MGFGDEPLAYFLTWTVYGTFLQGDARWWRKRRSGVRPPQPLLERWHRQRLKHSIVLLDPTHRGLVEREIERHCDHRNWKLWAVNARTNHVHVVVSASRCSGRTVRDQLKANCTRVLRESDERFVGRPVWSVGGDWKCLNSEDELAIAIDYVLNAQDKMDRKRRR